MHLLRAASSFAAMLSISCRISRAVSVFACATIQPHFFAVSQGFHEPMRDNGRFTAETCQ
jgi:hypothetical protein